MALKPVRLAFELDDVDASPRASCRVLNPAPCRFPSRVGVLIDPLGPLLLGAALAMEPTSEPPGLIGLLSPGKLDPPFILFDVGDMEARDEEPAMAPLDLADQRRCSRRAKSKVIRPRQSNLRAWAWLHHHHRFTALRLAPFSIPSSLQRALASTEHRRRAAIDRCADLEDTFFLLEGK